MNTVIPKSKKLNIAIFAVLAAIVFAGVAIRAFAAGTALATADQKTELTPYTVTNLLNVPIQISASATSNNSTVVDVRRHRYIPVVVTGRLLSSNLAAATLSIPIHRSLDGTNFATDPFTTLVLPWTSGTNSRSWATNIDIEAFGYVKFNTWVNSATNIATNIVVQIGGKQPWALTWPGQTIGN